MEQKSYFLLRKSPSECSDYVTSNGFHFSVSGKLRRDSRLVTCPEMFWMRGERDLSKLLRARTGQTGLGSAPPNTISGSEG